MPYRAHILLDIVPDLLIGAYARARFVFLADGDVLGGQVGPEVALALEGRDGEALVGGVGEPGRVDDGRGGGGGAGDGDIAFAEGGYDGGGDGGVVVAVDGVAGDEVFGAEYAAGGDEFQLRPVGWESLQGGLHG